LVRDDLLEKSLRTSRERWPCRLGSCSEVPLAAGIGHSAKKGTTKAMKSRSINATDGPAASGGYSQAFEVEGARRILHISGQIPVEADGSVPKEFETQARLAWKNIERQLVAAGMGLENIVKHTTYLSDREYRAANSKVRQEVLGRLSPALTVIIADIFDASWLLEIEAVAMD
jgi:2-iminobutanoate/2-iminopropanoate deaminase